MKLQSKSKILFLVLIVCIIFTVVFTETILAGHQDHDHDCMGKGCLICLLIKTVNNFLKPIGIVLLFTGCLVLCGRILNGDTGLNTFALSPVALKVRFNS